MSPNTRQDGSSKNAFVAPLGPLTAREGKVKQKKKKQRAKEAAILG